MEWLKSMENPGALAAMEPTPTQRKTALRKLQADVGKLFNNAATSPDVTVYFGEERYWVHSGKL